MIILFEDEDIIVINKPVGISSEADSSSDNNVLSELKKFGYNGDLYTLHRLDMSVGGVMVYAKNKKSAAKLTEDIQANLFKKIYLAVCGGVFEEKSGIMEDILFKDSAKKKSFVVKKERKGTKKALLKFDVISSFEETTLVKVELQTGRFHQIRCQFASRKKPLLGDGKYGSKDNKAKNIALFSHIVGFNHPKTGEYLEFSDLPDVNMYPWSNYLEFIK